MVCREELEMKLGWWMVKSDLVISGIVREDQLMRGS
jgi:hypothetical protein